MTKHRKKIEIFFNAIRRRAKVDMQPGGMPSGRPFGTPVPKEKSTPRHIPPQNVGKCEAPTLNEKWQTGAGRRTHAASEHAEKIAKSNF